MTLLAVPNVSEGRDETVIALFERAIGAEGARVLDVHADPVHNRTVLTVTGESDKLITAMVRLAATARDHIDLTEHEGVHPRVGALDVCPFVPHRSPMEEAIRNAHVTATRIGELGLPVFLYGAARDRTLPELRRGGLEGIDERVSQGDLPDFGPHTIDPASGIVCVGARGPLIAFNVNIDADIEVARRIATALRNEFGSSRGLRVLGLSMPDGSQVSMNLTRPEIFGIEDAFAAVERAAAAQAVTTASTELVGLVEQRFLPNPDAQAARLLIGPGRSIESAL